MPSIVLYNIYCGGEERIPAICNWISSTAPDVVVLLELNGWDVLSLKQRAESWNHSHSVLLHTNTDFLLGVTSSTPIEMKEVHTIGFHHGALYVRIPALNISLIATHLNPFTIAQRKFEVEKLREIVVSIQTQMGNNEGIIIAGDLNSLSNRNSAEHSHILSVLQSDNKLAQKFLVEDGSAVDYSIIDTLCNGDPPLYDLDTKLDNTVPTNLQEDKMHAAPMRLDYLLGNQILRERVVVCGASRNDTTVSLSDHYPVILDLRH